MIFLTIGTQLPFDRLVKAVDVWAHDNGIKEIFAQIGKTKYEPEYMEYTAYISPEKFNDYFNNADLIIAHAGMGTIISALEQKKEIIVFPRLSEFSEHRNDHQVDTANVFSKLGYVNVAYDTEQLITLLNSDNRLKCNKEIGKYAPQDFITKLTSFINAEGNS